MDGTTGDKVGTKQGSQFGSHNHSVDPPNTNTSTNGNHRHKTRLDNNTSGHGAADDNDNQSGYAIWSDYAGNHNHSVNIAAFNSTAKGGSETRPVNVNVIYCVKY